MSAELLHLVVAALRPDASDADRDRVIEWLADAGLRCFLENGGVS